MSASMLIISFKVIGLREYSLIYAKDHKTAYLFDPFDDLGPKRLALLKNSWAALFRQEILPQLPVSELSHHYSKNHGRPTKELFSVMGLMILQQMHNLNDQDAVHQFSFNIQWHYALNITSSDDAHSYLAERTLWEMRSLMSESDLDQKVFDIVAKHLAEICELDTSLQRLDSTHLFSNMKSLGRMSLFVTTIKSFLRNLKRHHADAYSQLDEDLCKRYMSKKGDATFASTSPEHASRKLKDVAQDLWELIQAFHEASDIPSMTSYKHMVRLFGEQCIETNDVDTEDSEHIEAESSSTTSTSDAVEEKDTPEITTAVLKDAKDIASDSLQNPSDPDATYDGHKGQGYQVQVMETCTESAEDKGLSLITHVSVEPAHIHDCHALMPAIEEAKKNGLAAERILADAAYGSDENCQQAAERGVEIVSPTLGNRKTNKIALDAFTHGDDYKIIQCPENKEPVEHKKGKHGHFAALFSSQSCAACPMLEECRVQEGKKGFYLRYTAKEVRLAKRRIREKSDAFRDLYAMRAGIEAGNSEGKQTTGLGQLRVRGMRAVTFSVTMKLVGMNIRRTTAFKLRKNKPNNPNSPKNRSFLPALHCWVGGIRAICSRIHETWRTNEVKSYFSPRQTQFSNNYL